MTGAAIKVEGLDKTLRALKIIDPEANKALRKGFREATQPIVDKARRQVPARPLSNWGQWSSWKGGRDLSWDAPKVARGITQQITTAKNRAGLRLVNRSAAGAIWETAGSKMSMQSTRADRVGQSQAFNRLANGKAAAPRLLVRTWKQEKGIRATYTAVGKLIADAEERVQKAMGN